MALHHVDSEMPMGLKDKIATMFGSRIKFVVEKRLTLSDVSTQVGCLLIPEKQVVDKDFLDEQDEQELATHGVIRVGLILPSLQETDLCLKRENFGEADHYLLTPSNRCPDTAFRLCLKREYKDQGDHYLLTSSNRYPDTAFRWSHILMDHRLESLDSIQVWSFVVNDGDPVNRRLWLAIHKNKEALEGWDEEEEDDKEQAN